MREGAQGEEERREEQRLEACDGPEVAVQTRARVQRRRRGRDLDGGDPLDVAAAGVAGRDEADGVACAARTGE